MSIEDIFKHESYQIRNILKSWLAENSKIQENPRLDDAIAKYSLYYDEIINHGLRNQKLTKTTTDKSSTGGSSQKSN